MKKPKASNALHRLKKLREKRESIAKPNGDLATESKSKLSAPEKKRAKEVDRNLRRIVRAIYKPAGKPSPERFDSATRHVVHSLDIHPLAELLPPMTESEFEALKSNLAQYGQVEDVMLLDGKILDGRHRYRAQRELNRPVGVRDYAGSMPPIEYVYSKAVHRNLNKDQKACAAVAIADELAKDAAKRQAAGTRADDSEKGKAVDQAGSRFGVNGKQVQFARLLRKSDEKLFRQVFNGGLKLSVATREIHRRVKRAVHAAQAAAVPETIASDWFQIVEADCVQLLTAEKLQNPRPRLIVADPPYNIGIDYGGGVKADKLPPADYVIFIDAWIEQAHRHLAEDGSLVIIINHEWAAEHVMAAKARGFHLRSWITWYEPFGVNCDQKFNRTSRPILHFTRHATRHVFHKHVFNRPSARQEEYGDPRAAEGGKVWDDIWGINPKIPRLVDNARERIPDFPTQLPEALIRPIVEGLSDFGDRVLDPFSGSGTTVAVCAKAGRRGLGIERSAKFAAASRRRIYLAVMEAKKK